MRLTHQRLLLGLFGAGLLACGGRAPGPRAEILAAHHDFGEVYLDEDVEHVFRIQNHGDEALQLGEITASCGCVVAEVSQTALAPGEVAAVRVRLEARGSARELHKEARIACNDPEQPVLRLQVSADIRSAYAMEPGLVSFGPLTLGAVATATVWVHERDEPFHAPLAVTTSDPRLSAEVREVDAAAGKFQVGVSVASRGNLGPFLGQVTVRTGHPRQPLAIFTAQASFVSDLVVEPNREIDFGEIPRGSGAERAVDVRRSDPDRSLEIESIQLVTNLNRDADEPARIHAELETLTESRAYRIKVRVDPGVQHSAAIFGRLDIRTRGDEFPVTSLTVKGLFR